MWTFTSLVFCAQQAQEFRDGLPPWLGRRFFNVLSISPAQYLHPHPLRNALLQPKGSPWHFEKGNPSYGRTREDLELVTLIRRLEVQTKELQCLEDCQYIQEEILALRCHLHRQEKRIEGVSEHLFGKAKKGFISLFRSLWHV
ncbi:hypothetical protein Taro_011743 [Colocasia esculenta]|uniref:Uncharacterized protein n=1 Tax=Colocasia esculenta TaxID=4460 RepID=A0A843UDJ8_COLES|nr:hypothetical protein [Colocasia esculenta]